MKQAAGVILLDTNRNSVIKHLGIFQESFGDGKLFIQTDCIFEDKDSYSKHLYLTSNDTIKEGDYGIGFAEGINGVGKGHFFFKNDGSTLGKLNAICNGSKKIIASSDKTLGLPLISDNDLGEYVKSYNEGNIITEWIVDTHDKASLADQSIGIFYGDTLVTTADNNVIILK